DAIPLSIQKKNVLTVEGAEVGVLRKTGMMRHRIPDFLAVEVKDEEDGWKVGKTTFFSFLTDSELQPISISPDHIN
ncbi:MAG: hypothetical protein ACOCYO_09380, partial [Bacteroidota bacterium]